MRNWNRREKKVKVSNFTLAEAEDVRDTVIERGAQVYEEQLKALLEPGHTGKFVAVEPETGRHFLGDTDAEALMAAHEAMPESHFYLKRIGCDFTHRIGGRSLTWQKREVRRAARHQQEIKKGKKR